MPLRLLYQGRPLAGALIVAFQHDRAQEEKSMARSDTDGRVRLPLRRAGRWLVKAVHMVPAPPGSGAEWESLWASLTFEMPPAANRSIAVLTRAHTTSWPNSEARDKRAAQVGEAPRFPAFAAQSADWRAQRTRKLFDSSELDR